VRWRGDDDVWLDHTSLTLADVEWLAPVRKLTMWAVKTPDDLLARLPCLEWLDLRGGSGSDIGVIAGGSELRYLSVNQIRGCTDLSVLPTLSRLELLNLYGLPRVTRIPSLTPLVRLRGAQVGSMKGLDGLTGLLDAPGLLELQLLKAVALAPDDPERIAVHPTIQSFSWFAEDVPDRVWYRLPNASACPRPRPCTPRSG